MSSTDRRKLTCTSGANVVSTVCLTLFPHTSSSRVKILAAVLHPNLVKFLGYCTSPALLIIMAFCDGGDLSDYIRRLDESGEPTNVSRMLSILLGVAKGLA